MSRKKEIDRGTRDKMYLKLMKQGKTIPTIIDYAVEEFGLTPKTAAKEISAIRSTLKKDMATLREEAIDYIMTTLIGTIEDFDKMPMHKLKALDQLAKVCKVYDEKPNVTVINGGFKFGTEE